MALGQHDVQAVRQGHALHRRQLERHRFAGVRRLAAIQAGIGGGQAGRERIDLQHEVAVAEPVVHRLPHHGRGGVLDALQVDLVAVRIAGIGLARGQQVALAAEAADALDHARVLGQGRGLGQAQFGIRGAALHQRAQFFVGDLFHLRHVGARTRGQRHAELAADLGRAVARGGAGGQLILVHQALVQARGLAAAQHARGQVEQRFFLRVGARHVPGAVDARLRHAVLRHRAVGAGALGDPGVMLGQRRARRDRAIETLDLLARFFSRDVARQHQHRIVRAIVLLEPVLDVGHRGRVEVFHLADHGPGIRVTGRVGIGRQEFPGDAVRLVFVLAFLVLHHAALDVELLLVDRAQQVAHAIALGEQRIVEHRGRHVLEVIGAILVGGAVQVGRADALHRVQVSLVEVVAAAEHQVFEQVGEAGLADFLVLRTDVVPGIDRHHRRLAVFMHQHRQPVLERELGVLDIRDRDVRHGGRFCRRSLEGRRAKRKRECCGQAEGATNGNCHTAPPEKVREGRGRE